MAFHILGESETDTSSSEQVAIALKSISEGHSRIVGICDEPFKKIDVLHSVARKHGAIERLRGKNTHYNYQYTFELSLVQFASTPGVFHYIYPGYTRYTRECTSRSKIGLNR